MKKTETLEFPETFEMVSGVARISDPCYSKDISDTIQNVKRGTWEAHVIKFDEGSWGTRCGYLVAHHKDHKARHESFKWTLTDIDVGVDSGQAGIFEEQYYKDDSVVEGVERMAEEIICEDDPWYSICCDRTLCSENAGVMPYGVVSSSGYGDGCYSCSTITENGEIVAIMIDFGLEEEEEEDYEEYCEECGGSESIVGYLSNGLCRECIEMREEAEVEECE